MSQPPRAAGPLGTECWALSAQIDANAATAQADMWGMYGSTRSSTVVSGPPPSPFPQSTSLLLRWGTSQIFAIAASLKNSSFRVLRRPLLIRPYRSRPLTTFRPTPVRHTRRPQGPSLHRTPLWMRSVRHPRLHQHHPPDLNPPQGSGSRQIGIPRARRERQMRWTMTIVIKRTPPRVSVHQWRL